MSKFNRSTLTDEGMELVCTIMEAKELIGPSDAQQFDTFVQIYMVPDEPVAQQTKVCFHVTFQFNFEAESESRTQSPKILNKCFFRVFRVLYFSCFEIRDVRVTMRRFHFG